MVLVDLLKKPNIILASISLRCFIWLFGSERKLPYDITSMPFSLHSSLRLVAADINNSLLWYRMATLVHLNVLAIAMKVRLAADRAGTVLKKYGKMDLSESSPEAAEGETCNML